MAKTITDEDIKLNVIINGNNAQKELYDLERANRKLNESQAALRLEKKRLEAANLTESARYKELTGQIKENSRQLNLNKARMTELQREIGVTGLTMKQLTEKANLLKIQLRQMIPGSEDFNRIQNELKQVSNRLDELRGKAQQGFDLGRVADNFNRFAALGASVIAFFTGVALTIRKVIDLQGELSDAQARVMKTTQMDAQEVDDLSKKLMGLKTRTSLKDLLGIAEQGGLLGVAKNEIFDFVQVMNEANVAMGDAFEGGAEEVANSLGKIKGLYDELEDASVNTAFKAVGSAINDLGANGAATESNIAQFVTRLGSLPPAIKPSIAQALGLGAAFEESGLKAEIAGTNYGKVISIAARDFPKFAQVMKMTEGQVKQMLNTDPTEFFLKFANSLNGLDATQLATTLDYLKLNDNEVKMVLGAAAKNTDMFREKIELASKSMGESTSMTKEYNIQNNTLGAVLDKIGKKISGYFTSETINKWIGGLVIGFGKLIGAIETTDGTAAKWRNTLAFVLKLIVIVTAAMITHTTWQKLVAYWTTRNTEATLLYNAAARARAFADGAYIVITQALAAAQMLLTGNIKGATQAIRVMTATMMTTPWGFVLTSLAAVATAFYLFSDSAKDAATSQEIFNRIKGDAIAKTKEETAEITALFAVARDENATREAKIAAINKINEILPEHIGNLTLEKIGTFEAKKMIDQYIKSLEKQAMVEIFLQEIKSKNQAIRDKEKQSLDEEVQWYDMAFAQLKRFGNTQLAASDVIVKASSRKAKSLEQLRTELKLTKSEFEKFLKDNPEAISKVNPEATTPDTPDTPTGAAQQRTIRSIQEMNSERLEMERKFQDDLLKLKRQYEDDALALKTDSYEKEVELENLRYLREVQDLEKQKVNKEELAKLDEKIAKAKSDGDTRYYRFLLGLKKDWSEKNIQLEEQINQVILGKAGLHKTKLATISERAAENYIKQLKEQFDREKILRETAHQDELNALGNDEQAKKALNKKYEEEELERQKQFLQRLLDEFNKITSGGKLSNIDLSLLSPEQVEEFKKKAEEIGLELSKLIGKKQALSGSSNDQLEGMQALGLNTRTDILGFTQENWDQFFKNLEVGKFGINEMAFAFSALTQLYAAYDQFVTANENRQLQKYQRDNDQKKTTLKRRLDAGIISQAQYDRQVKRLDDELDKRKAEIEYRQAKRQRIISVAQIVTNTAQAIMSIWAQVPKFDFGVSAGLLTGMVSAIGALQLATVLAQPLPAKGFEKGLYPDIRREQDGKVFKATGGVRKMETGLFSKPTVLVGEGPESSPEMIIDKKAYAGLSPALKNWLWGELATIKGFENGFYNQKNQRFEVPAQSTQQPMTDPLQNAVMLEILELLRELREKGVEGRFSDQDMESMKYLAKGLKKYNSIINKSKS